MAQFNLPQNSKIEVGKYFKDNNRSVVFGAADTFRAAAIDQLQVWALKL